MTTSTIRRPGRRQRRVTIGIGGADGSTISWSREDETNLAGHGYFAGTPELVDAATAIVLARAPITLPTGIVWTFPPSPDLRVVDVAAAMLAALQVDAVLTDLISEFPELRAAAGRTQESKIKQIDS